MCAKSQSISREEQDEYAALSYQRSQDAAERGIFTQEIVPVTVPQKKGTAQTCVMLANCSLCAIYATVLIGHITELAHVLACPFFCPYGLLI